MLAGIAVVSQALLECSRRVNRPLFLIGTVAVGLMVLPTTVDVAGALFHKPLPSAQEMVEFLQVILVYGCLGYVHDLRGHIYVEIFFEKFPTALQNFLTVAQMGITAALFGAMTWRLALLGLDKLAAREIGLMLGLPISLFVLFAALGCLTTLLSLTAHCLEALNNLLRERRFLAAALALAVLLAMTLSPWWLTALPDFSWMAHKTLLGGLGMLALMILLLLGCPVGFAMMGVGFVGLLLAYPVSRPALSILGVVAYITSANYMYSVVPMFILMGELATQSGISRDLFHTANVWLGRQPGGLAIATVAGCAGFAAVSGDSMATAVTMASVALPEMEKRRYRADFACATLAAGGTLGILIPPSTGFIFYSLITEESIGRLFLAGIAPGLLLAALFMLVVVGYAKRHPEYAPRGAKTTWKEKFRSLQGVIGMVLLIALVLGGILSGKFSPNQGGAVGAAGTFLYALARGRMTREGLLHALMSTAKMTAKLMMILIGVGLLGNFFAVTRVPFVLADVVLNLGAGKYAVFAGVVALYIVLGCMVNVIPMIMLTLPALFPTIKALGFDPVWFGVVSVILMEMGQITPPVGLNVFAMSSAAPGVSMAAIFRHIVPYFVCMFALIGILLTFPEIALWLPTILL